MNLSIISSWRFFEIFSIYLKLSQKEKQCSEFFLLLSLLKFEMSLIKSSIKAISWIILSKQIWSKQLLYEK